MHKHNLSLQMSQIIASDAPLLSPTDACWETTDSYAYYQLPPSPPLSDEPPSPSPLHHTRMLRAPLSPDLCVPTHQLFDFADATRPPTPPSRDPSPHPDQDHAPDSRKRSASPSPGATKRRAIGERISSKDFVPPDVSGLSKREARLVKNRAAAFLSRQRKREEFECMEVRVAELEQENARLLSLAGGAPPPPVDSEVEQLRARLAAAEERERTLSARLASTPVKQEAQEPFLFPPPRSPAKAGASLGLMVLLCALPSLLAIRAPIHSPTGFAIPSPFPSQPPAFDYPAYLPADYDWPRMDSDDAVHTLRFAPDDDAALAELAVSFEASPTDARTIRVRIHPAGAPSSASSSGSGSTSSRGASPAPYPASAAPSSSGAWDADPFLGAPDFAGPFAPDGSLHYDYAMPGAHPAHQHQHQHAQHDHHHQTLLHHHHMQMQQQSLLQHGHQHQAPIPFGAAGMEMDFGMDGMEFKFGGGEGSASASESSNSGRSQRVRIAMRSPPGEDGEGGEWEVRLC